MEFDKLLDKTIRFISFRPRSEKEILDYLARKIRSKRGSTSEEVEPLMRKLKQLDLVDDEKFARWWIEQRATFRPKGKRALRMELRQKGVKEDLIDLLIEKEVNEKELALAAARKKIKFGADKLYNFLARRGFSLGVVKEVVDELTGKR